MRGSRAHVLLNHRLRSCIRLIVRPALDECYAQSRGWAIRLLAYVAVRSGVISRCAAATEGRCDEFLIRTQRGLMGQISIVKEAGQVQGKAYRMPGRRTLFARDMTNVAAAKRLSTPSF